MIYPTRKGITIRGPLAPSDWEYQEYVNRIGEIDERNECLEYQQYIDSEIDERDDWLEYQLEKEDYNTLSHEERIAEEAAVDRWLDQREDREQGMLEAQWHKAEQTVPTTVTAIIHHPTSNQLLYVMGSNGQWELPWGPITVEDTAHGVYSPHEMSAMMSMADMLLSTLGVRIKSCQWVSTGICRPNGEDYEVTLVDYPVVDGVTVKWQDSEGLQLP